MSIDIKSILANAGSNFQLKSNLRIAALLGLHKNASKDSLLGEYYMKLRSGDQPEMIMPKERKRERNELYGVQPAGFPDKKDWEVDDNKYTRSLSTRYSPDRPGVQAQRVSDGVYKDPYTGRIYDWNEGFETESGEKFEGSSVQGQTDLYRS